MGSILLPAFCIVTYLESIWLKQHYDAMQELMAVAGRALKMNITRLGPLVLPLSEKMLYASNLIARKVSPFHVHLSVQLTTADNVTQALTAYMLASIQRAWHDIRP